MMRRIASFLTLTSLVVGAAVLFAHDPFEVTGTLSQKEDTRLEVTTKEGYKIWIALPKGTIIRIGKKEVTAAELKTGQSVVVDAMAEDYPNDLEAYEVIIVPAAAPKAAAPKTK